MVARTPVAEAPTRWASLARSRMYSYLHDRYLDLRREARHHPRHDALLAPLRAVVPGGAAQAGAGTLGAVLVPTFRGWLGPDGGVREELLSAAELAASQRAPLVLLASGDATVAQAPRRELEALGAQVSVVDVNLGVPGLPELATDEFAEAVSDRHSDLSAKRNAGLLLGLLCGWDTWLFRDDDIRPCPSAATDPERRTMDGAGVTAAVRALLDGDALAVGWREMRGDRHSLHDNSVVGHARRAAGREQGVFVGGGALAVRSRADLPFFPHVYNEDWLFMLALGFDHGGLDRTVARAGDVWHAAYDPFRVDRARGEEFGDILAEGLFGLLHHRCMDDLMEVAVTREFWEQALEQRVAMVAGLCAHFDGVAGSPDADPEKRRLATRAREALDGSLHVAKGLTPEAFVAYLTCWRDDLAVWREHVAGMLAAHPRPLPLADALAVLGLRDADR